MFISPPATDKRTGCFVVLGTVGHPNVGKSSLINGLMGRKVVSTSRTPGHTKHFQTMYALGFLLSSLYFLFSSFFNFRCFFFSLFFIFVFSFFLFSLHRISSFFACDSLGRAGF